jgi:hypothetical protein
MGFASKSTINRATNTLLGGTHATKLEMLRTTPINPPHGYTGMELKKPLTPLFEDVPDPRAERWSKLKIADVADMVGFLELGPVERDQMGAMTFAFKTARQLPTRGQRAGMVPCWFLPWQSGFIFKMKLSSFVADPVLNFGGGIDPMPNPGLFFTAGINGCSVFAVGDPKSPSVYHGGFDPGSGLNMPLLPNETTEQGWQRLLGRSNGTKFVGSVGKGDYIAELKNPLAPTGANGGDRLKYGGYSTTSQAMALQMELEKRDDLTQVSVSPWGCVFGLRDAAANWTFTLVKNATVIYYRLIRKKRFLQKDKVTRQGEMMPKQFGQKERGANGLLDLDKVMKLEMTEQTIINCVNLGYMDFFPASSAAHYRDLKAVSTF